MPKQHTHTHKLIVHFYFIDENPNEFYYSTLSLSLPLIHIAKKNEIKRIVVLLVFQRKKIIAMLIFKI